MSEIELTTLRRRVNELEERIIELERRLDGHTGGKPEEGFPEYMGKTSAAKAIGVTRATVYKMIEDGRLQPNGMGKVMSSSVEALMKEGEPIHKRAWWGRRNA